MSTDPNAHLPFFCTECDEEIPPNQDHGVLPDARILCRRCFAAYDGDVQTLAPNRAAAVAYLTARGLITPTEGV